MPDPTSAARFKFVFVLGVPHCGSTLLGMMLNSHPDIACVGEMVLTGRAIANQRPCSCGQQIESCSFWQALLPILKPRDTNDYRRYTVAMYEQIRTSLGKRVLVDLSKAFAWRMTRSIFSPWKRERAGYIFLIRDSRAVVSSKPPSGQKLDEVLTQHKKWMRRLVRFAGRQGDRNLTVHYEDLCANPRAEMLRICEWMGVPFNETMLNPYGRRDIHHFVNSSISKYTWDSKEIRLDDSWRRKIDAETQAKIESVMRQIPVQAERYLTASR
jgi:hypothetical protein